MVFAVCGRRATAWELLLPIRGWIDHAGGSDAQVRVLHQTVRSLEPSIDRRFGGWFAGEPGSPGAAGSSRNCCA